MLFGAPPIKVPFFHWEVQISTSFPQWNIPLHTHTHAHTKKRKEKKKKLIRVNQMLSTLGKITFLSLLLSFLMLSCRNAFLLSAELGHDSDGEQNSDKGNTLLDCRKTRHRNAPSQLRKRRINSLVFLLEPQELLNNSFTLQFCTSWFLPKETVPQGALLHTSGSLQHPVKM